MGIKKSLSNESHSNRSSTCLIMPSSAEKSRERVKRWKKENPERYKQQRKRYNRKHANANYERLKTWRRENPDQHKAQKQRERRTKQKQATEQHDSSMAGFEYTDEMEIIVNQLMASQARKRTIFWPSVICFWSRSLCLIRSLFLA